MGGGRRRSLRRVCLAASGACVALSIALPALAQDDTAVARPAVWHGAASAEGATFEVNRDALLPVPNAFRFTALQGRTAYDTDLQTSRASIFYPGEGVLQGPNLACGTFGGMFPPEAKPILDLCATYDYPLSVFADSSLHDKATTGSLQLGRLADPVSADAISAKAHADVDSATSTAVIEDLRVLGLPGLGVLSLLPIEQLQLDPTVATIAGGSAKTNQRIDEAGHLVVQSDATLSGVNLVGGLVHIGSIVSSSKITDDGNGKRTSDASFELGGVTVGGIPAQITEKGLVLGSPAGASGPIQQQLQDALQQLLGGLGVKLSLLPNVESTDDKGQAVASAAGILLEISLNVQGAPTVPGPLGDIDLSGTYVGNVRLGATEASGAASTFGPDGAPTEPGGEVITDGGGDFTGDGGLAVGPATPPSPGAPRTPSKPTAATSTPVDLFGGRLELLYLAFALAVLGLCITPRLALPARLPGPRS